MDHLIGDPFGIFIAAFIALFVIVDPVGTTGVFSALTAGFGDREARLVALRACGIATALLVGFGFCGLWILEALHISLPAFRIAGGLLLFVTAFRMIMGYHDPDQVGDEKGVYRDRSSIAVFPLSIPLLAGPGCMTASLMLMGAAHGPAHKIAVVLAIAVVEGIALLAMLAARRLSGHIGSTGNSLLARIMGILLAAMAVQFVIDGLKAAALPG